ncbi:Flp pilus assembly complex ATPase component TadA [Actinomycetaceae bacterium TAE3-ERU4]|nr:Flp pilus assembly complex ATPase component TadA [Actinomycetaceae bacterium TAE3-ERU4]
MLEQQEENKNSALEKIAQIFQDSQTTDLLINPDGVWVETRGKLQKLKIFWNEDERYHLARVLSAKAGNRLDLTVPIGDGTVEIEGIKIRIHAVIPPICPDGTSLSLRKINTDGLTLEQMVKQGSICKKDEEKLRRLINERANLLISGGTGSGKTTLLSALTQIIPHNQRIICIEQDREINTTHPHVVRLTERCPNLEGRGKVTLEDLVHAAMRMRPERIILGECRGSEVTAVLNAMNTGHDGSLATIHANSADDVLSRLQALASLGKIDPTLTLSQANSGIDAIVHLERDENGRRYLSQIKNWKEK